MTLSMVSLQAWFFFNDTATTEIYTLSLHDALPISFSPDGDSIGIRLEPRGEFAELLIGDSGPGVPREDLARIFDRYFSQRPPKIGHDDEAAHFGIGLWIARRNVEALGGSIRAENRQPNGLLLRIKLPLSPAA